MVKVSKNKSIHYEKQNVDISNVVHNNNQITSENKNNKNVKFSDNLTKSEEYGHSDDEEDSDESTVDNEDEDIEITDEIDNDFDNKDKNYLKKNKPKSNTEEEEDDEDEEVDEEEKNDGDNNSDEDEKNNEKDYDNYDEDKDVNYIDNDETLKSKCYSKYVKIDNEELDLDELFGDETSSIIKKDIKISKPVLTKYEYVRLLTDRTKQLAQGAKPMLKNIENLSSKEIAKLELKNKIIPLIIERPIPNSISERWKLTELEIPEYLFL